MILELFINVPVHDSQNKQLKINSQLEIQG
jgi:hypothetical protein